MRLTIRYRVREASPAVSPKGQPSNYNCGGVPNPTLFLIDLQVPPSLSEMDGSGRESKSGLKSLNAVYITLKTISAQDSFIQSSDWLLTQKHASAFA